MDLGGYQERGSKIVSQHKRCIIHPWISSARCYAAKQFLMAHMDCFSFLWTSSRAARQAEMHISELSNLRIWYVVCSTKCSCTIMAKLILGETGRQGSIFQLSSTSLCPTIGGVRELPQAVIAISYFMQVYFMYAADTCSLTAVLVVLKSYRGKQYCCT